MRIFKTLFGIGLAALFACSAAAASSIVTATVTVTNAAGTANGETLTANGDTRTWTNSVFIPASQILTNALPNGAATNLFNQIADAPFTKVNLAWSATNAIQLQGIPGLNLIVTLSSGWGTVTFTTNALTSGQVFRLPITIEPAGQQTNLASMAATALESSTNPLSATDILLSNYESLSQAQTISGVKQLTNAANLYQGIVSNAPSISGTAGTISNGLFEAPILVNPISSNLVNRGSALSSPGSVLGSEQFGAGAQATGGVSVAVGALSTAGGLASISIGTVSAAYGIGAIALGEEAYATNQNDVAVGTSAIAAGTNSTAIGTGALVAPGHTNSTALGFKAQTTAANQMMLGSPGISVIIHNALQVNGGITAANGATNLLLTGTNNLPAGSDIAFGRFAVTSLANGSNSDVPAGTNVFVEVSGPSGGFTINGISGAPNRDGKFLIILNQTTQNMTVAHDSGVEATAANRIYTMTGADRTTTGNGAAMFIYSASASRWILINLDL